MLVRSRTWQEEGVVGVSSGVLLWLEEGVEIPERTFYEIIGWHFCETKQSHNDKKQHN